MISLSSQSQEMSHLVDGFNLCPYPHLYLWWLPLEAPKTENTRMTTVHHIRSQFVLLLSDGVLSESKASETWRETQRCSESLVDCQCSPQTLQTRSLVFPPPKKPAGSFQVPKRHTWSGSPLQVRRLLQTFWSKKSNTVIVIIIFKNLFRLRSHEHIRTQTAFLSMRANLTPVLISFIDFKLNVREISRHTDSHLLPSGLPPSGSTEH